MIGVQNILLINLPNVHLFIIGSSQASSRRIKNERPTKETPLSMGLMIVCLNLNILFTYKEKPIDES